jgi:hypothetical protein
LAKATETSIPITSPVDFISGDSTGSTRREAREGEHRFLHRHVIDVAPIAGRSASVSPAMIRRAILAIGWPIALATNGTVRLARVHLDQVNSPSLTANWMFITAHAQRLASTAWRSISA